MANIRTSHKSGFLVRGGVKRRETLWLGVDETNTTVGSVGAAVIINSLSVAALALRPFTIIRVRGNLFMVSDQQAASETYQAALGACVVSFQSSVIGVTAVPTPVTDRGSDLWFLYEAMFGRFTFGSGVAFIQGGENRQYDSKGMRKVNDDQDAIFVLENAFAAGTTVGHEARMLIKLH